MCKYIMRELNTKIINIRHKAVARTSEALLSVLLAMTLISCSTGIESTKTIKMNREETRLMAKTAEQTMAESLQGTPLSEWKKGKRFLAMSDRTALIFDPMSLEGTEYPSSMEGKILTYEGIETRLTPDLTDECILVFSDGTRTMHYATGKTASEAIKETVSGKLPLLSDLDLIEAWKGKLNGKKLWTRSDLWYDSAGNRVSGVKYYEVKVTDVLPSTGDFPINVKIAGKKGEDAYMHMNYTADTHDSRNFAALFFLTDPRTRYPQITDENWELIQQGKVAIGMTKEECKLSLGNPDELRAGHSQSQIMDIWQYSNGRYLMFTDGLLTKFRL